MAPTQAGNGANGYPVPLDELPSNYRPTNCPKLTPPSHVGGRKGYNLFVGTLPPTIDKEQLEILFTPFGSLEDTYLLKQEGKCRWKCGFVSFGQYSSAAHAIARLNGFTIFEGSQPICVRFANPAKSNDNASVMHLTQNLGQQQQQHHQQQQQQRHDTSMNDSADGLSSVPISPNPALQSRRSSDVSQNGMGMMGMQGMLLNGQQMVTAPQGMVRVNPGQQQQYVMRNGRLSVAVEDSQNLNVQQQFSGIPYSPASSAASIGPDATPTPTPGAAMNDFNHRKQLLSNHAGTTLM